MLGHLPKSLKENLSINILEKFFDSKLFSKGEKGVNFSIIKRLSIKIIPKDEYIVRKG